MAEAFHVGDHVQWNTSQGITTGRIEKKLTGATEFGGHHVAASAEEPQYLVRSDKTGKEAAHKPKALKKVANK